MTFQSHRSAISEPGAVEALISIWVTPNLGLTTDPGSMTEQSEKRQGSAITTYLEEEKKAVTEHMHMISYLSQEGT